MNAALAAFESWKIVPRKARTVPVQGRQDHAEAPVRADAVEILEVGKTWPEADADVAEAIDFLEFYGREMLRYGREQPVEKLKGERGKLVYLPLGSGS